MCKEVPIIRSVLQHSRGEKKKGKLLARKRGGGGGKAYPISTS